MFWRKSLGFSPFFFCRLQIGTETHSDSEINKLGVRALPISTMRRFSKLAHRISLITNADGQLQQLDTTHGVIFHFYLSDNRPLILRIHSLVRPWVARALTTGTWSTTDMRFITFLCGNSLFYPIRAIEINLKVVKYRKLLSIDRLLVNLATHFWQMVDWATLIQLF